MPLTEWLHAEPDCPIRKIETPSELRLDWDNRATPQDSGLFWVLLLFWLIWAPLTVYVTSLIFRPCDFLVETLGLAALSIGGWLGTILIPCQLLQRYWCEWIVISKASLVCGKRSTLAAKPKCFPIANIVAVKIGYRAGRASCESVVTLNVIYYASKKRTWEGRHMIGYWLHPDLKEKVFCDMQEFCRKNEIPLSFQRS